MRFRSRIHFREPLHELLHPVERDRFMIAKSPIITTTYRDLSRPEPVKYMKRLVNLPVAFHRQMLSVQDNRRFHPDGSARPSLQYSGRVATVSPVLKARVYRPGDPGFRSSRRSPLSTARRYFNMPMSVIPCIRRKVRREVIMALHGGGASHARKRRNWTSDIGC